MATTYTKALKSIVITTLGGNEVTADDTATSPVASQALMAFANYKTMVIPGDSSTTYVPFHAVDNIVVTTTTESAEKADPYGCPEE